MWTKICANTNVEDAQLALTMGADAVGFVFAPSKRQVTVDEAAEIVSELPGGTEAVGVFLTDDPYRVQSAVDVVGLTAVQLHGAYRASMVQHLAEECGNRLKVIQTMAYDVDAADREDADARFEAALRLVFGDARVWAVLLDAAKAGASGGLGVSFDWERVGKIVRRTRKAFGADAPRVILAGGLRAENVGSAIATMQPWGVDVASGVEAAPGKKDPMRLQGFLAAAKATA